MSCKSLGHASELFQFHLPGVCNGAMKVIATVYLAQGQVHSDTP